MGLVFLITSFIVVIAPGTGVLYTLAAGLTRGARASVIAAFGCTLGIVPHIVASLTGVAAILNTSAVAFQTLKILGVCYLLYMAWTMLRNSGPLEVKDDLGPISSRKIVTSAILINVLNPKLSIFFLAFLPQFISVEDSAPLATMMTLSLVFMAMTFAVFIVYGVFAAGIRRQVISRPAIVKWMQRSFAAAFVALGARLAFSER
ncbi:MAG: LysE family translocator [Alphaproteobacteria bacterium]|nr:LysE family translocator [Alphaproteobacteria bacterium]